jgi:hypothetical protein
MRIPVILVVILLFVPAAMQGQSLMRLYRMMYSVSGSYSSGQTDTDLKYTAGPAGSEYDHETIMLSTRNGYFVSRSVVLGFEFDWQQGKGEVRPRPNPTNARYRQFDRDFFFGPLFRWYQPMSVRWFVYPEVSVGYHHYLGEFEESSSSLTTLQTTTYARGVGINAGAGLGYFLSRNLVLDATIRYSHRWLGGGYQVPGQPDVDVEISGGEIGLLLGLQFIY